MKERQKEKEILNERKREGINEKELMKERKRRN